jgi:hypothetical protein
VARPRIGVVCSSLSMLVASGVRRTLQVRVSIVGRTVARWTRTAQPGTTAMRLPLGRAARTRMRRSARTSVALTISSADRVLARRVVSTRAC